MKGTLSLGQKSLLETEGIFYLKAEMTSGRAEREVNEERRTSESRTKNWCRSEEGAK
jgi:hypothetical protein